MVVAVVLVIIIVGVYAQVDTNRYKQYADADLFMEFFVFKRFIALCTISRLCCCIYVSCGLRALGFDNRLSSN